MPSYTLSHLEDHDVQKGLLAAVPAERTATAAVLAHLAEFDARQLYRDQACSSMFVYCTRELGYSEDGARKRIHAARAARQFPLLFDAVADGRLHLCGLLLLAPCMTEENAEELVALAAGHSRAEIQYLLAAHGYKPASASGRVTESASSLEIQRAPGRVEDGDAGPGGGEGGSTALEGDLGALLAATSPGAVASAPHRRDRLTPISADAWALEATLDQESCDMLRRIQALRGRRVSPHDIAGVIKRAFALLEDDLLLRKLGAGTGKCRGSKNPWHITPVVMRVVWKRDDARCTFVGTNGKRCNETHDLQFDHIIPPDRGGDGAADNVRLRCRAHNLHAAEKLYGLRFMQDKREEAKAKRAAARAQREAERTAREAERLAAAERRHAERVARDAERERQRATADAARAALDAEREQRRAAAEIAKAAATAERERQSAAAEQSKATAAAAKARIDELVPPLRSLGCSLERARQAAATAECIPEAPFEARLRVAIQSLAPRGARKVLADGTRAA